MAELQWGIPTFSYSTNTLNETFEIQNNFAFVPFNENEKFDIETMKPANAADWRRYIPWEFWHLWKAFSLETKKALFSMAEMYAYDSVEHND